MLFHGKEKGFSLPCVYPKDYILVSEGDLCEHIGFIHKGTINMIHYSESGEVSILATLKTGDVFGDLLIFSSEPNYLGHLVIMEETSVSFMSKADLIHHIDTNAFFRHAYMKTICDKARNFNLKHKLLQQATLKEKILFYLETEIAKKKQNKVTVPPLQEWAQILNVQRPSLSRSLKDLVEKGILQRSNRTIWFS